jgi:5-methylcytosine-specific restriction protein A
MEHRRSNRTVRRWYYRARWVHPEWGLRAQVLAEHPWCVVCHQRGILEPATEIDHITPHRGKAELFWNPANLQGLCTLCHHRKTGQGA